MIQETIKPQELRIGNWAEIYDAPKIYKSEKGIIQVEAMTIHYMQYKDEIKLRGIPLSSDILLKAGFERFVNVDQYDYKKGSFGICYDPDDDGYFLFHYCEKEYPCFKYVHQLQNLYFCLVGEDLKIDL